ncbi:MAG TPA: hypothetical protein VL400_18085 [Polyangiaceae bacterium]|nr:hypothetical protein [Polyangiaceae bacterium]
MSSRRDIRVLTHGHCFDGMVSAALFTALRKDELGSKAHFRYRSLGYGPKLGVIPEAWLTGDENALLDFKHTASGRLDWYFDHHKTAFASDRDRDKALATHGKRHRVYYDPECTSCAKLIARVATSELDFDVAPWAELVEWADKVDSARFDSADEAFRAEAPALVLADVVEHHGDGPYLDRTVPLLVERPLVEVANTEETKRLHAPIARAKATFLAAVRERGKASGDVVLLDLADGAPTPAGKFATYVAFPRCTYSVAVLRTRDQIKVGVGHNPWSGGARRHDLAELCRREGGGGHPVVGAIAFADKELDRARAVAQRIALELAST